MYIFFKKYLLGICILSVSFLSNCTKKEKGTDMILSPEEVINISAAQKAKAAITGERKNIDIGRDKQDVWTILYKDSQGDIHSTVIKKRKDDKNKVGDSLIIYYDNSNPASLPIYEEDYKKLKL